MGEGTNGLTDERVRELASWFAPSYADDPLCNWAGDAHPITEGDFTALAREVLALRERVAALEAERVSTSDEGTCFAWPDLVADLRRQRDDAVELAREAVGDLDTATRTGYVDQRDMLDLATRLAWIIGDESPTPERDDG